MFRLRSAVMVWTVSSAMACGMWPTPQLGTTPPRREEAGEVRSSLARITTNVASSQVAATVHGLNDFSFELNRRTVDDSKNSISSPLSITTALSMASAGAAGTTLDAFRQTLHVTQPASDFHASMNTIDRALASRGQGQQGTNGRPFRLSVVNQTFAQSGLGFEPTYLDLLAQQYGAGVRVVDFARDTEGARTQINDFVSQNTGSLIPQLIKKDVLTADSRVVLANAVFFDASWASPFAKASTQPRPFHLKSGGIVTPDTMANAELIALTANVGGVEVVSLPYQGGELSMVIAMPPAGGLAALEAGLTDSVLASWQAALRSEALDFTLPRFSIDTDLGLDSALKAAGLELAYSDGADFTAMTRELDLHIQSVVHHAVIKVTEEGTEAAGATAVIIGTDSVSFPNPRPLAINRPFLFAIVDHGTGAVLFLGHVVDPR